MIIEPWPEIRYLLFEASSQANTSGGRNFTSFFMYSSTCFTASDLTVMLPLASTRSRAVGMEQRAHPVDRIGGLPEAEADRDSRPCGSFSAAASKRVPGPGFRERLVGGAPAGYIFWRSIPACCLNRSMRPQGPLIWLPGVAGMAIQCPSVAARGTRSRRHAAVRSPSRFHHVVDRLELLGLVGGPPVREARGCRARTSPAPRRRWSAGSCCPAT